MDNDIKRKLEYYIERDSRYIKDLIQQVKENQSILRVINKGEISPELRKNLKPLKWRGE